MQKPSPKLRPNEWAAVAAFLFIIVFIAICNFVVNKRDSCLILPENAVSVQSVKKKDVPPKRSSLITVFLEGNVQPRGAYEIKRGTTLKELYRKLHKESLFENMSDRVLKSEEVIKF